MIKRDFGFFNFYLYIYRLSALQTDVGRVDCTRPDTYVEPTFVRSGRCCLNRCLFEHCHPWLEFTTKVQLGSVGAMHTLLVAL